MFFFHKSQIYIFPSFQISMLIVPQLKANWRHTTTALMLCPLTGIFHAAQVNLSARACCKKLVMIYSTRLCTGARSVCAWTKRSTEHTTQPESSGYIHDNGRSENQIVCVCVFVFQASLSTNEGKWTLFYSRQLSSNSAKKVHSNVTLKYRQTAKCRLISAMIGGRTLFISGSNAYTHQYTIRSELIWYATHRFCIMPKFLPRKSRLICCFTSENSII